MPGRTGRRAYFWHRTDPGDKYEINAARRCLLKLPPDFRKLQRELRHLEIRQDHRARLEEKARWKAIHKSVRKIGHKRSGR